MNDNLVHWGNVKTYISDHAYEKFIDRHIYFNKRKNINIRNQIQNDLRMLNIRKQEKQNENTYKITTRQNKVYIIELLCADKAVIKTVYQNKHYY